MPAATASPGRARRFAELLGLSGIILAEPVLTALREGADVFVTRRAGRVDVVGLTLLILFGLPLALLLLEELVGLVGRRRGPAWRDGTHRVLLGGLGVLVVIRLVGQSGLAGPLTVALAVAGGITLWAAVSRWAGVSPLAAVPRGSSRSCSGAWFLATDPVRGLVIDVDAASGASASVG